MNNKNYLQIIFGFICVIVIASMVALYVSLLLGIIIFILGLFFIKMLRESQQSYDDVFETIFESDYITIPDMEEVKKYAIEQWGEKIGGVTPSTPFTTGQKQKIKIVRLKKEVSSQVIVDCIESMGGTCRNVFGLAVIEIIMRKKIRKYATIWCIDEEKNLSRRGIPYSGLDCSDGIDHGWDNWETVFPFGKNFLIFFD